MFFYLHCGRGSNSSHGERKRISGFFLCGNLTGVNANHSEMFMPNSTSRRRITCLNTQILLICSVQPTEQSALTDVNHIAVTNWSGVRTELWNIIQADSSGRVVHGLGLQPLAS